MASVTSLDGDLRKLRLDKYTPGAAREVRAWIEGVLGEPLAPGDLLDALKDGVALCRLANLAIPPPGIRFKKSAMPFVQMENISHFLRACQAPPLNLQQHDTFLTVDLYEAKDPAQVLQCLGAFSRAANRANPSAFPTAMGPRSAAPGRGSVVSPQTTGSASDTAPTSPPGRGVTPTSNRPLSSIYSSRTPLAPARSGDVGSASSAVGGRWSPAKESDRDRERSASPGKSPTSTSTWSKRELEGSTAPAWNIAQYGYMGGASQGNLGISFGGRRQITSAGPHVPNAAEKARLRKEKEAEEARARKEEEERRRAELEAEEERARQEEQRMWEEETRRQRAEELRKVEEEKRRWEEEERQWKLTEEARRREEEEAERRLEDERQKRLRSSNSNNKSTDSTPAATGGDPRLRGQLLSQYQAETAHLSPAAPAPEGDGSNSATAYSNRVRELEKELELARQREQAYERERQGRSQSTTAGLSSPGLEPDARDARTRSRSRGARSRSRPRPVPALASPPVRQESWSRNEKEVLRTPRSQSRHRFADLEPQPAAAADFSPPPYDGREDEILPREQHTYQQPQDHPPSKSPRPLPDPRFHAQQQQAAPLPQPPQQASGPAPIPHGRPLPDPSSYAASSSPAPAPPQKQQQQQQQQHQQQQRQQPPQPTYAPELLGGGVAEHDAEDRRRRQQAYHPQHHQYQQQPAQEPQQQQQLPPPLQQRPQPQQQPLIKQRQPQAFRGPPAVPARSGAPPPAAAAAAAAPAAAAAAAPSPGSAPPRAAGKSLLEREMEMERQRQREWEEAQRATAAAPRQADNVDGVNGRWDVNQWSGFTGGDSQNRGSQGIGAGRRQIVGPRPLPGQR